ncbi:MAG: hypothetical protein OEU92_27575, partial [Alphaproteobacteria bacterium]|nr:hypothetical protein [Alphaproteobacteria bacterium]
MPNTSTPARRRHAAVALSLALACSGLIGCVAEMPSPPADDRFLVEPIRLTHRVTFARGAGKLNAAEQYRLAAFLDEVDPDDRADIYLDATGPDKNARIDAVAAALGGLGRESAGSGGGAGTEHGVTVTLLQDVVLPESCLNSDGWPTPDLPPASCTTALSLVQMVEDQDDLLRGREMGPALSATAARAATRHLERTLPTPAEERSASSDPETTRALPPAPSTRDASY